MRHCGNSHAALDFRGLQEPCVLSCTTVSLGPSYSSTREMFCPRQFGPLSVFSISRHPLVQSASRTSHTAPICSASEAWHQCDTSTLSDSTQLSYRIRSAKWSHGLPPFVAASADESLSEVHEVGCRVAQRSSAVELSSTSVNTLDTDASPDGVEHSSSCELFGLASPLLLL